jgi:hypothetical protein
VALRPPTPPSVKSLVCRGCGAPLEIRAPGRSIVVACGACGAVLDAQDPDAQLIAQYETKNAIAPRIPLGTRGRLEGEAWEVIGYQVRRTIDDTPYSWFEHLLYHPTHGFRWLVEASGHFTLVKTASGVPETVGEREAMYLGTRYRHFQQARAETVHVVGEFPWIVKAGDTAVVDDFVQPPLILSRERTGNETTWSAGEYITGEAVWKGFALPGSPPEPVGVGAAQPSPYRPRSGTMLLLLTMFIAAAVLIHIAFAVLSQQRLVLDQAWQFSPNAPATASVMTGPFVLEGRTSNVVAEISTTLSQSWGYFTLTLVDEETEASRTFGREVSYYFGRDSDGAWTEGVPWDRAWLPSVPAGRYVLIVEPEGPQPFNYRVRLTRDVPRPVFVWLAIGALILPPLVFWWRQFRFEARRWEESDRPTSGQDGNVPHERRVKQDK